MIRILNAVLLVVTVLLFASLYHIRYAAEMRLKEIRQTEQAFIKAQNEREILEAEWVSLNNPERLEKMASDYLTLAPLRAEQIYDAASYETDSTKTRPVASSVSYENLFPEVQ
ncbi:MAG: cell division protein FtsL [Parvibaculales bacterium]